MRDFPHLKDNGFPYLENENVYAFVNRFEYTRWNVDTKLKLVNVLWDSTYRNVVKFETNAERDAWFDSLTGYHAVNLTTAARVVPDNYVKLPIPYDVVARYNYLYVDVPFATSEDMPLDYEWGGGVFRWYFFINEIVYLSPSSTQVFVTLDTWTNFANDIDIRYMMLERGHAPMHESDVDEYLSSPIDHNEYLLAPDVNYDNAGISRSVEYVPFGNGTKYVCIASTCPHGMLSRLGETITPAWEYEPFGTIPMSYEDVQTRYGKQLSVHGYTIGNGTDYGNLRTPATPAANNRNTLNNGLEIYAIPAAECYDSFYSDVLEKCPNFLNTVKACFVVDENCLNFRDDIYTIAGHNVRICSGSRDTLLTKQLERSDFSYPVEYADYAKLYTAPYARLEITDNDGRTFDINIEETSTLKVKSVVSVAFPYINMRVFIEGIGGTGYESYTWRTLTDAERELEISNSDWGKFCFDWEIPTFALYADAETMWQVQNFNRAIKQPISDGITNYQNTMRNANTAKENAEDLADTALANVNASTTTARTNAYDSADTGSDNTYATAGAIKANADAAADAGKRNADRSADASKRNTDDSANAAYLNTDDSVTTNTANVALANSMLASNEEEAIQTTLLMHQTNNNLIDYTNSNAATLIDATTATNNDTTVATTNNNGISKVAGSALSGITGGVAIGMGAAGPVGGVVGGVSGMLLGAASGAVDAYMATENATIITNASVALANATKATNLSNAINQKNHAGYLQTEQNDLKRYVYQNQVSLATAQDANNATLARGNATRTTTTEIANATRTKTAANDNATDTRDTTKANAQRTYDAATANADRTKATARGNAGRNYDNDRANATRTHDTSVANAGYTQEVAELNAKATLENAARARMAAMLDARNAEPKRIGETTGNPAPDYMHNRGLQIKVKTQSDSAIRQTGDTFARYGYALNQVWNVQQSGLCLMKHFTYWKAHDVWVDDRNGSTNRVQREFEAIFINGVTVWSDPTKIGKVSIYDN